jgi:hypothetical protein
MPVELRLVVQEQAVEPVDGFGEATGSVRQARPRLNGPTPTAMKSCTVLVSCVDT